MFSKCLFESLFPFPVPIALQNCSTTAQRCQAVLFQPGFSMISDFGLLAYSIVFPVILLHVLSFPGSTGIPDCTDPSVAGFMLAAGKRKY
jgi:hypothetical protein